MKIHLLGMLCYEELLSSNLHLNNKAITCSTQAILKCPKFFLEMYQWATPIKNIIKARAILTKIAQSVYSYKNYPTEEIYIAVTQELIKMWPFLDKGKGIVRLC